MSTDGCIKKLRKKLRHKKITTISYYDINLTAKKITEDFYDLSRAYPPVSTNKGDRKDLSQLLVCKLFRIIKHA